MASDEGLDDCIAKALTGDSHLSIRKITVVEMIWYPPYSHNLDPCDFFLLGHMKKQLKGRSIPEDEKLLSGLSESISEIPPGMISSVFPDWDRRLRLCIRIKAIREILSGIARDFASRV
jgi:hypothetical protein